MTGKPAATTKQAYTLAPDLIWTREGPVKDHVLSVSDGQIVGVVVSKLDAEKVFETIGDVPQNVNFAIRGEIAKLFLSQNAINPKLSLEDNPLAPEDLAEQASKLTTFIECN